MKKEKQQNEKSLVMSANQALNSQIADPSVMRALTATVFKEFNNERIVKQACLEAMMRGYSFQDIINKRIYAIPFGGGYSLVQSIADVRAIAMKSGQVGKDAPIFKEKENKIISCTVTVKRKVGDYIGDYTATVYFDEYNKGRDNWKTKPRTMIAKVAEMHALRMAFPEELAQSYVEEEFQKDNKESNIADKRLKLAQEESKDISMGNLIKPPIKKHQPKKKPISDAVAMAEDNGIPIINIEDEDEENK